MSAKNEYRRYLTWLQTQHDSNDAKRVAVIVFDAFDRIAPTSANQSQRTRLLLPLLEELLAAQAVALPAHAEIPAEVQSWKQLRQLVVGPFRGFLYRRVADFLGTDRRRLLGSSREELMGLLECRVHLELWVKVVDGWTHDANKARRLATEGTT